MAEDVLSLVVLLILSFSSSGIASSNGLGTVALLAVLQCASMVYALVSWDSFEQVLHAGIVLFLVIFTIVLAKKKHREFEREVAAFIPKY